MTYYLAVLLLVVLVPSDVISLSEDELDLFDARTYTTETEDDEITQVTFNYSPTDSITINMKPTRLTEPTCLPDEPIGIARDGTPILRPYTPEGFDAVIGYKGKLDKCSGYSSSKGKYYFGVPKCLLDPDQEARDQFIGVAADGYSIYGPKDINGDVDDDDLDECHGREEKVHGEDVYRYRMTNTFPYTLGCFHGELVDGVDESFCVSPSDCGEEPGELKPKDPKYAKCGGGQWTGQKNREWIQKKLDAANIIEKELKEQLDLVDKERKERRERKEKYEAEIEEEHERFLNSRSLRYEKMDEALKQKREQIANQNAAVEKAVNKDVHEGMAEKAVNKDVHADKVEKTANNDVNEVKLEKIPYKDVNEDKVEKTANNDVNEDIVDIENSLLKLLKKFKEEQK